VFNFDNPLVVALQNNNFTEIKTLINNGISVSSDNNSLIRYASYFCDYQTNLAILDLGADPFANNHEPIMNACSQNNVNLVKHLLSISGEYNYQELHSDEHRNLNHYQIYSRLCSLNKFGLGLQQTLY
jgi:hypothetical protein